MIKAVVRNFLSGIALCVLLSACSGGGSSGSVNVEEIDNTEPPDNTQQVAPATKLKASIDAVIDVNTVPSTILSSSPSRALVFNEQLLFIAKNSDAVAEWFISDGSEAGTHPLFVSALRPAPAVYGIIIDSQARVLGDLALVRVGQGVGAEWWVTDGSEAGSYRINSDPLGKLVDAFRADASVYVVFEQGIMIYHPDSHAVQALSPADAWFGEIVSSYYSASRNALFVDVRSEERAELWRVSGETVESLLFWPLSNNESSLLELSDFSFAEDYAAVVYRQAAVDHLELIDLNNPLRSSLVVGAENERITINGIVENFVFYVVDNSATHPPFDLDSDSQYYPTRRIFVADAVTMAYYLLWSPATSGTLNSSSNAFSLSDANAFYFSVQVAAGQINVLIKMDFYGTPEESYYEVLTYLDITTIWLVFDPGAYVLAEKASWNTGGFRIVNDFLGNSLSPVIKNVMGLCDEEDQQLVFCVTANPAAIPFSGDSVSIERQYYQANGTFIRYDSAISAGEFLELMQSRPDFYASKWNFYLGDDLPPVRLGDYWYQTAGEDSTTGAELYRSSEIGGPLELVKDIAITSAENQASRSSYPAALFPFQQDLLFTARAEFVNERAAFYLSDNGEYGAVDWQNPVALVNAAAGEVLLYQQNGRLKLNSGGNADVIDVMPEHTVLGQVFDLADRRRVRNRAYDQDPDFSPSVEQPDPHFAELADAGRLYLKLRSDGVDGTTQLWFTDGTPAGTQFTGLEIAAQSTAQLPDTIADGYAWDISCGVANITELSNLQTLELNYPAADCTGTLVLAYAGDKLLVRSTNRSGTDNNTPAVQLWTLTHDGDREMLANFASDVSELQKFNEVIYFMVEDTLWRSDLSVAGTFPVASALRDVGRMVQIDEQVFFVACDQAVSPGYNDAECNKLWSFDSTADKDTVQLIATETLNEDIFISYVEHVNELETQIPPFGTSIEDLLATPRRREVFIDIFNPLLKAVPLVVYQKQLIFSKCQGIDDCRLWTSDGSPNSARLLLDIGGDARNERPEQLTVVGDSLYLSANVGDAGRELVKLSLQMVAD